MRTKYTKGSRIATFRGVCFQTFSHLGNIFGKIQDFISPRYEVSGIRNQGSGVRDQGSGNREQESVN